MKQVNELVNKNLMMQPQQEPQKALDSYSDDKSANDENFALVDGFFLTMFGNLWSSQFVGEDYLVKGREMLWKDAVSEFSFEELEQALAAMNRGEFEFKGAMPLPLEFARFCKQLRPRYRHLPDYTSIVEVPLLKNKDSAAGYIAKMKEILRHGASSQASA